MEKPIIYLDVLLSVNLCADYVLLIASAKVLGIPYRKARLLLGAMLGAAGSLSILLPVLPWWAELPGKLILSAGMTVAAYSIHSWKEFLRHFACFYGISFAFGGILLAASIWWHPSSLVLKNSAIYLSVPPLVLLVGMVICYGLLSLLYRWMGRSGERGLLYTVTLWKEGRSITVRMKEDTGNHLTEPFSGLPVAILSEKLLQSLLPDTVEVLQAKGFFRMVPYESLSGSGLLYAFRPDRCWIQQGKECLETNSFYVAMSPSPLKGCQGLLHSAILSSGTKRRRKKPKKKTEGCL